MHPGFVLLTRVDLGPIALMLFFKALCLVLLFKWLEGPQRICWSVFGVCLLGFFDKFNFIWFVVAVAFSTSAILWSRDISQTENRASQNTGRDCHRTQSR